MKLRLFSSLVLTGLVFSGCATDATAPSAAQTATPAATATAHAAHHEPFIAGGYSKIALTDPSALAAAQAVAATLGGWKVTELLEAESQVVAGTNYRVIFNAVNGTAKARARGTVWKRLDGQLEVTDARWIDIPAPATEPEAGGFTRLKVADSGVQEAAKAVIAKIGDGWTLSKVVSAQSQVVAGTNYKLTLFAAKGGETKKVAATVWKKLDGSVEVVKWRWDTEGQAPAKEGIPGGFSKADISSPEVAAAAKAAVAKIGGGWTLAKVASAQSQVVAGTNYKLTLNLAKGAEKKKASATVWRKLDGSHEVTEWKWL